MELDHTLGQLLQGNISVISLEKKQFISNKANQLIKLYQNGVINNYVLQSIKIILHICNILYNRSDMLVPVVDDGLYDALTEIYKKHDENFQVGSAVLDLQAQYQQDVPIEERKNAIFFYEPVERDEIRQQFCEQIQSFDVHKLDKRDIYPSPITFECENNYISKRTHNTKHNHPDLVGTLDKCKFVLIQDAIDAKVYDDPSVSILERDFFHEHIKNGIITEDQELEMVVELKYDGISVEADCNRTVQSARTRGDTGIGEAADITPILKGYSFKRNNVIVGDPIGVKFEAIILRSRMEAFNQARERTYANCRTAIIGLFGNSDAWKYRDFITLIPIAVDREQVPEIKNRLEEIEFINKLFQSHGEPLRYVYIKGNFRTCLYLIKKFAEEAMVAREYLDFMFDGIVVSYLDESIREKLGRKNFINKYQMAVKFNPLTKLTTFFYYTFEVGQNGVITPMIHYAPVEFFGTIHPKSSGSSYKRFCDLNLKPGDIIQVTYRNDVMPYVSSIDCEQNRQNQSECCTFPTHCPECGEPLVLSDSRKTMICTNLKCNGRAIPRMSNMLQKLNIKGFADSTIQALHVYSFHEFMEINSKDATIAIGPGNADNLMVAIDNLKKTPIEDYVIIGSLGFTNLASKFWKLIFSRYTLREFYQKINNAEYFDSFKSDLLDIKGVGPKAVQTIFLELNLYKEDIEYILLHCNIIDSKYLVSRKIIRFSGCRNKQLEEQLISMGYDADGNGSVTKTTDILVIPYDGYTSSKTKKIDPKHTIVVSMSDFTEFMDEYLDAINGR